MNTDKKQYKSLLKKIITAGKGKNNYISTCSTILPNICVVFEEDGDTAWLYKLINRKITKNKHVYNSPKKDTKLTIEIKEDLDENMYLDLNNGSKIISI